MDYFLEDRTVDLLENRTFDEIQIGDTASLSRTLTKEDIQLFAVMSGDVNPAHLDEEYARSDLFHKIIAHGMWGGSLISTVLGTIMPGPGAIYLGQTLRFKRPVTLFDTITVSATAAAKDSEKHRITFDCHLTNQRGEEVITGTAELIAPTEKIIRPRVILPEVRLHDYGARHRQLVGLASGLAPIRVAVIYPVDRTALLGAIDPALAGLIIPVLIGPQDKIQAAAEEEGLDLGPYEIISAEDSHTAILKAVALARKGEVEALMKGSLRTEELMQVVVAPDYGLRTNRRMSHVAVMDVPTYPRPLFITDGSINIYPTLEHKRDITQNAIDLARSLNIEQPRVALLSAIETVNPKVKSSLEAAGLCKMADRGQITGGLVDGPLAFDDAVSAAAAQAKGINSPVAGQADILVAPDLETATMLTKQLEYLAEAQAADIVLGARAPIILNSSSDNALTRQVSCAIALLLAYQKIGCSSGLLLGPAQ